MHHNLQQIRDSKVKGRFKRKLILGVSTLSVLFLRRQLGHSCSFLLKPVFALMLRVRISLTWYDAAPVQWLWCDPTSLHVSPRMIGTIFLWHHSVSESYITKLSLAYTAVLLSLPELLCPNPGGSYIVSCWLLFWDSPKMLKWLLPVCDHKIMSGSA